MRRSRLISAIPILLVVAVADGRAQTAADLFDRQTLQEVRVFINSRDLSELRQRYQENIYYPADFLWRGLRLRNVGIRVRGGGSRSATKPGLRVDFTRYTSGQTFLGLSSLVLDNVFQDPALIRESVSMAFFDRMGQPAPRESFGRLYINNTYQGVYAIVEDPNEEFMGRVFGDAGGYLFEYKYVMPYYGDDLGDDLAAYKPLFEPRAHRLDADSVLYPPIRDLFRAANGPDDGIWRQEVERYVDLPQFVTLVAIEIFLSELDGVAGYAGMNNFYLYRSAATGTHRVIPWDRDNAFQEIESSIFERAGENVLLRRALAFQDLRALYLDVLDRCAQAASEDDWLLNEMTRRSAVIADAAHEDLWKASSNEAYDAATDFLKEVARLRPAFVRREVAKHK